MAMPYRATCSVPASALKSFTAPGFHLLIRFLSVFAVFALAGCAAVKSPIVASESAPGQQPRLMSFGPMPVYFIENRGQTDYRAAYYIRGKDKSIYFTSEGVAFSLAGGEREKSGMFVRASYGNAPERWLLKLEFVGAKAVVPVGEEATPAMISYFKGPKEDWKAGVKTYAKLVYADLWPGIDLVYSGTSDRLKYEFVVKPGADPKRIQLAHRGASSVNMNTHGELEIATPAGTFRDDRPLAYQESAGGRAEVAMRYRLKGDSGAYGFDIGAYDRGKPLVLDPAIFIYSGFIGGA